MTTPPPRLTFFTELEEEPLVALFSDPRVVDHIASLDATISMGILDFSAGRAEVVRQLNARGVRLVAWQLLPKEQGYWYSLDSASFATERYRQFCDWSSREDLQWEAIGIDIEPHIDEFRELLTYNLRTFFSLLRRLWKRTALYEQSWSTYEALVTRMQADGYSVESYELFFMADERLAGSSLLSRLLGIVHTPADKRVGMLYSSLFRPFGAGLLRTYARLFDSSAVGVTGGGVELDGVQVKEPMSWEELARDLRIARRSSADIHIFSLEGCVARGYLERLPAFDWDGDFEGAPAWTAFLSLSRVLGTGLLWLFAHPVYLLVLLATILWILLY